jgi:hypothetical protein
MKRAQRRHLPSGHHGAEPKMLLAGVISVASLVFRLLAPSIVWETCVDVVSTLILYILPIMMANNKIREEVYPLYLSFGASLVSIHLYVVCTL